MAQDTKDLVDAILLLQGARIQAQHFHEAWLIARHAQDHLQKQLSALLREAEEAA